MFEKLVPLLVEMIPPVGSSSSVSMASLPSSSSSASHSVPRASSSMETIPPLGSSSSVSVASLPGRSSSVTVVSPTTFSEESSDDDLVHGCDQGNARKCARGIGRPRGRAGTSSNRGRPMSRGRRVRCGHGVSGMSSAATPSTSGVGSNVRSKSALDAHGGVWKR